MRSKNATSGARWLRVEQDVYLRTKWLPAEQVGGMRSKMRHAEQDGGMLGKMAVHWLELGLGGQGYTLSNTLIQCN